METIISSLVSAFTAIVVCVITQVSGQKKQAAEFDKQISLIDYKLTELTEKVSKHNNLVERVYHLEEQGSVQEERQKVANNRISDLERRVEQ